MSRQDSLFRMTEIKSHSFHSVFTKISPQRFQGQCYTSVGKRESAVHIRNALEKNSASRSAGKDSGTFKYLFPLYKTNKEQGFSLLLIFLSAPFSDTIILVRGYFTRHGMREFQKRIKE
jgi:hypothetical protein